MQNRQIAAILNDAFPLFLGKPLSEKDECVIVKPKPGVEISFDWRKKEEIGGIEVGFTHTNDGETTTQTEIISFEQLLIMDYKWFSEWVSHQAGLKVDW